MSFEVLLLMTVLGVGSDRIGVDFDFDFVYETMAVGNDCCLLLI